MVSYWRMIPITNSLGGLLLKDACPHSCGSEYKMISPIIWPSVGAMVTLSTHGIVIYNLLLITILITSCYYRRHRQWVRAVRERYVADEKDAIKIHGALADYFDGKWAHGKPFTTKEGVEQVEPRYYSLSPLTSLCTLHYVTCLRINRFIDPQPLFHAGSPNLRKISELPYLFLETLFWLERL